MDLPKLKGAVRFETDSTQEMYTDVTQNSTAALLDDAPAHYIT